MQKKRSKVLIVDDEFRIAQLIKKLIDWDELGLECIGTMDNGESAYELIVEERPEIVITDIRMPKVNGLDLIRLTREQKLDVRFVVISGYKEFEYAHQALQYGVKNYLLKPIDEEELNQVLKAIQIEVTKEAEVIKTVTASEHVLKRNLLNNIMEEETVATIDGVEKEYKVNLGKGVYRGIDIKLDYVDPEKADDKQDALAVEKVVAVIEQNLKDLVIEELICEKEYLHLYCLINYEYGSAKDVKGAVNDILSDISEYLIGFERYVVTIGIGEEKEEFSEIRFSINEAYAAAQNRIKHGCGRLIYAETVALDKQMMAKDYLEPYKNELYKNIESCSNKDIAQTINKIYSVFQLEQDYSGSYEVAGEIIRLFFERTEVHNKDDMILEKKLMRICQHCISVKQLKDCLKKYLGHYLEVRLHILKTEATRPIRQAKQYIEERFAEKIVLEDIAQIVDLNPVYFSVLFKQETKMNFSTYLVYIRMEAAKKMLCNTNETIAAVAECVGYKDARYFSQIFAKTVGVKPALYRKLHS